jgi:hypothetical protein
MEDNKNKSTLNLVVAPIKNVKKDFLKNLKYIIATFLVLLFYILVSSLIIRLFEDKWSFYHSFYFTVINTTTVGFGDITPLSHGGKIIACLNAIVGLIFFGAIVGIITLAFQPSSFSGTIEQSPSDNNHDEEKGINKIAEGLVCLSELLSHQKSENSKDVKTDRMHIRIRTDKDLVDLEGKRYFDADVFIYIHENENNVMDKYNL